MHKKTHNTFVCRDKRVYLRTVKPIIIVVLIKYLCCRRCTFECVIVWWEMLEKYALAGFRLNVYQNELRREFGLQFPAPRTSITIFDKKIDDVYTP